MSGFNKENGSKVAQAIENRIRYVVNEINKKSSHNYTKYGIVTKVNQKDYGEYYYCEYSVKINNVEYKKIFALRNVKGIKVGDRVVLTIPNGNMSDMFIYGILDGFVDKT